MRGNFFVLSLISAMLFLGFVSCGGEGEDLEVGFNDMESISMENPDAEQPLGEIIPSEDRSADVQRWRTISTGQKDCYDGEGKIPCPNPDEPYYGQDGSYQYGVRSYTDNLDSTVTDDVTGVVWQKGFKDGLTWYEAQNYCDNLTLNSQKWRIPLTHELKSLIDYGLSDPAIDTTAFPGTPSGWFWAGKIAGPSSVAEHLRSSWIINFFDGFVEHTSRTNIYNVRCVRVN